MTGQLAIRDQKKAIHSAITDERWVNALAKTRGDSASAERYALVAYRAAEANPFLYKCSPKSWQFAIADAARFGLEPSGVLGHGYLVPRRNKGEWEVQFQPGYLGLAELAYRSGKVRAITCDHVFKGEHFEHGVRNGEPFLNHTPGAERLPAVGAPAKGVAHVYAIVLLAQGGFIPRVLSVYEVQAIRATAKDANGGREGPAWRKHWAAMAYKSALIRALKMAPKSIEMRSALTRSEGAETGIDPTDGVVLLDEEPPQEPEQVTLPDGDMSDEEKQAIEAEEHRRAMDGV